MESRSDPRGGRGGHRLPGPGGPSARQLLARLDARPLAARAAADVSALVRKAGASLRLRSKEAISDLDSADIEVTDSRLPRASVVEHGPQHHRSHTLGIGPTPPAVTQGKASYSLKPSQASDRFSVELVRGPVGFGFTLSGGQDPSGETPLAVRCLLKDGPAQRCRRLQAGDLVIQINGEATQGLSHAQVVERIRSGGPHLRLTVSRPQGAQASRLEEARGTQKRGGSPDPRGPKTRKSEGASVSPTPRPPNTPASPEPSAEAETDSGAVPSPAPEHPTGEDRLRGSPGPWLVPSEERLSRALGIPRAAQIAQETAAGRRRH